MLFEEFHASVLEFYWQISLIWVIMHQIRQQVLVLRQNTFSDVHKAKGYGQQDLKGMQN